MSLSVFVVNQGVIFYVDSRKMQYVDKETLM